MFEINRKQQLLTFPSESKEGKNVNSTGSLFLLLFFFRLYMEWQTAPTVLHPTWKNVITSEQTLQYLKVSCNTTWNIRKICFYLNVWRLIMILFLESIVAAWGYSEFLNVHFFLLKGSSNVPAFQCTPSSAYMHWLYYKKNQNHLDFIQCHRVKVVPQMFWSLKTACIMYMSWILPQNHQIRG